MYHDDFENGPSEKKAYRVGFAAGAVSAIVLLAGLAFMVNFLYFNGSALTLLNQAKIRLVSGMIDQYYYKDVPASDLANGLLKGLVSSIGDKYSAYYTPDEYQQLMEGITGEYAGIGVVLSADPDTGVIIVNEVYEDSPAAKAGIRAGDILVSTGEYQAASGSLEDFVKRVRGNEGEKVEITYERNGKSHSVQMKKETIQTPSVTYTMLQAGKDHTKIGYIRISEFSSGTEEDFKEAVSDLEKQGMEGIIFDLRTNPGGLVDSVTKILDAILPKGTTVYMKDKEGKKTEYISDEAHKMKLPMTVLTSGKTASAGEIFAGAIRDYDYGTLIGTTTYGKGIVQQTFPLADGSAVKLTIETYYTPKGDCIHEKGIAPDIEMEYEYTGTEEEYGENYAYEKDNQVVKAEQVLLKEIGK